MVPLESLKNILILGLIILILVLIVVVVYINMYNKLHIDDKKNRDQYKFLYKHDIDDSRYQSYDDVKSLINLSILYHVDIPAYIESGGNIQRENVNQGDPISDLHSFSNALIEIGFTENERSQIIRKAREHLNGR